MRATPRCEALAVTAVSKGHRQQRCGISVYWTAGAVCQ